MLNDKTNTMKTSKVDDNQQVSNGQLIHNFMMAVNNFMPHNLQDGLDATGIGHHFSDKIKGYCNQGCNGSEAILKLIQQMNEEYVIKFAEAFLESYNNNTY